MLIDSGFPALWESSKETGDIKKHGFVDKSSEGS